MNPQTCKTCGFWRSPDTMRGYCYLKPPVIVVMPVVVTDAGAVVTKASRLAAPQSAVSEQILPTSHRPITLASDFCGEWRLPWEGTTH